MLENRPAPFKTDTVPSLQCAHVRAFFKVCNSIENPTKIRDLS